MLTRQFNKEVNNMTSQVIVTGFFNVLYRLAVVCGIMKFTFMCLKEYGIFDMIKTVVCG